MTIPDTIQATLHPDALKRITRMFTATVADVLSELLQNARRAGANNVWIEVDDLGDESYVRITDDGSGIADPQVLLSFGENDWNEDTVNREDAAGMGFAALSQFESTVVSQPAARPAWQVHLTPAHFAGEQAARVFKPDTVIEHDGTTRISFRCRVHPDAVLQQVQAAARYYPLPVNLRINRQIGSEEIPVDQAGFLDDCPHRTEVAGIDVGARILPPNGNRHRSLNFFGHVVSALLPTVQDLNHDTWGLRLDVKDCSDLQLTLPARREVIDNDFYKGLQDQLTTVLYEAIAASDSPWVSHDHHVEARRRGVNLPVPKAQLKTWTPETASGADAFKPLSQLKPLPDDAFLVPTHDTPAEELMLRHALHKTKLLDKAFACDDRVRAYAWYDHLPKLDSWEVLVDGTRLSELDYPTLLRDSKLKMPRPEKIEVRMIFRQQDQPDHVVAADLDYALSGEPWEWLTPNTAWFLTEDCGLSVDQLANLLEFAFFDANEDFDSDTLETQQLYFRREARDAACELLLGGDEALRNRVHTVLLQALPELFFEGQDLTLRIRGEDFSLEKRPSAAKPA